MKMLGQVKEANRFLRGIDFEEATDSLKKIEVIFKKKNILINFRNNSVQLETARHLITNDINYVCSRLHKDGQQDISQIFAKVRSEWCEVSV